MELKMAKFNSLGVMLDMSRNSVMNLSELKSYLSLIKRMGYNTLFLYTEDTYEVDGEPYFGYMRGRYSKEEMKELDSYAASVGIEVIPCVQTLAHLNALLRWDTVGFDCNDIILADDPRTYELIEHMFTTLSECFTTRKIHVGMDEAHMLGRGKHLDIHGYEAANDIIARHLKRVCEIAKKFDYEVMLWSDMFFRSWNDGVYSIKEPKAVPESVLNAFPNDVIPVYWNYFSIDEKEYDVMLEMHRQFSDNTWFAGGLRSWGGFMPHNEFSMMCMSSAIRSCEKNKIKNVFMTLWGDDGGECSRYSVLPSLFYVAELARGNTDIDLIKAKFTKFSGGITFDEFMLLDAPNNLLGESVNDTFNECGRRFVNPSKYMLYSDYFNGYLDYTVVPGASETYKNLAAELNRIAAKSRKFGRLFKTAARLCEALEIKYELGVKTREAYQSGDREALRSLAEYDYVEAGKRINAFALAFEKQWFAENKPHGFDIQDGRLGTVLRRTSSCRRRLLDYLNGKIDSIPELEEKLLPYGGKKNKPTLVNRAFLYMSTNVLSH